MTVEELRIDVTPATLRVSTYDLPARRRQAIPPAQAAEVDLRQGLGATFDVAESQAEMPSVSNVAGAMKLCQQSIGRRESLLDAGRKEPARVAGVRSPGGGVNQRPLDACVRRKTPRTDVVRRESTRLVYLQVDSGQLVDATTSRHHDVDAVGPPTREAQEFCGGAPAERRARPGVEDRGPLALARRERSVVQYHHERAYKLPAASIELGTQMGLRDTGGHDLAASYDASLSRGQGIERGHARIIWRAASFTARCPQGATAASRVVSLSRCHSHG